MDYRSARRSVTDPMIADQLKDVTLEGVVPLEEELGRGAYSRVFAVKYCGVVCAAKEIHQTLIDSVTPEGKQAIKESFIRECVHCGSLHHPNVVQCMGVFYLKQSSFPIMVMEMMKTSLTSYVQNNQLKIDLTTKISILHDVSLGLSYLHGHEPPIIHCDLSPNNVMLTSQLVAKIGDLGMAKVQADSRRTNSKLTTALGTLGFMPPEVLETDPVIYDTPIDVFSFGGIALHVFSEEWPTPLAQKKQDTEAKYLSAVERRQQYLDKITGRVASMKKVVERCLNDDPYKRPPMQAVVEIIESLKVANSGINEVPKTPGVTTGQDAGEQKQSTGQYVGKQLKKCTGQDAGGKSTKTQGEKEVGSMSAGDQKAIVVENGSYLIKAGFGGEDSPIAVFPAVVGTVQNQLDSKEFFVGDEARIKTGGDLRLNYPIDMGFVCNWEDMEKIWHHIFYKKLCVDPEDHPALLIESRYSTKNQREKMTQIMFETFNTPSMYLAVKHALSLFASGRTTGMVIQSGDSSTSFLPVYEGYGVPVSWQTLSIGGRNLTDYMKQLLKIRYPNLSIDRATACDIKEKLCSMEPPTKPGSYELPDGKCIVIDKERCQCPEVLFNPGLVGYSSPGIHHFCNQTISLSDDIRKELYENIVLAGGNTLFPGIGDRLQKEITDLAPPKMNVKVIAPPDQKYSAWIGGSMLASLSSFQPKWITKQEYDEYGPTIVHRKCL